MRTVITDPDLRKQMEAPYEVIAAAAISEKNQKLLQQMQEAMVQPDIKERLEANPEYKQILEDQIRTMRTQQLGAGAALDLANSSNLTIRLKDSSILAEAYGRHFSPGANYFISLYQADSNKTYQIDHANKTCREARFKLDSAALKGTITQVPGDSIIHGFACEKYTFVIDSSQYGKVSGHMWVTAGLSQLNSQWVKFPGMAFFTQAKGFPVYIFLQEESQKERMFKTFALRNVEKEKLAASTFKLPGSYSLKE